MKSRFVSYILIGLIVINLISGNGTLTTIYVMLNTYDLEDRHSRNILHADENWDPYFSQFIADNTQEDSVILVSDEDLVRAQNTRYTFPRDMVYFENFGECTLYPETADYIALSIFADVQLEDLCQEKYGDILEFDYLGFRQIYPPDVPNLQLNASYLIRLI